jgi:hypothetical protein
MNLELIEPHPRRVRDALRRGQHAFHAWERVVRCGGLLSALDPALASKHLDPQRQAVVRRCVGFNDKNAYDRQTPCDRDMLRKYVRDVPAAKWQAWFNGPVQEVFQRHGFFDPAGVFIGDGSYLFVPDNPAYEDSVVLWFDEHHHPVEYENSRDKAPDGPPGTLLQTGQSAASARRQLCLCRPGGRAGPPPRTACALPIGGRLRAPRGAGGAEATPERIQRQLNLAHHFIVIYLGHAYLQLPLVTFTREVLELAPAARDRALQKIPRLEQSFLCPVEHLRPP